MCTKFIVPADPIVKYIHNKLFEQEKVEKAFVKLDRASECEPKYILKKDQTLLERSIMQIFATSSAVLCFSIGLFCQTFHYIIPTISYYSCLSLCIITSYLLGMFAGATFSKMLS